MAVTYPLYLDLLAHAPEQVITAISANDRYPFGCKSGLMMEFATL
jgi:hypothetical protein